MITAISSCLFKNNTASLQDILDIKKTGIKYLELDLTIYDQIFPEFSDFIRKNKMGIYSIHSDSPNHDISGIDKNKRMRSVEDLKKTVDMAVILNARSVVVHPSASFSKDNERKIRVKNCIDSLVETVKYASKKNIKIAIENNVSIQGLSILGEDIDELDHILKKSRKLSGAGSNTGICLDTGHAFLANTLFDSIDLFKDDILMVHLSDNPGRRENIDITHEDDSHLPPGSGKIDWKRFFGSLDKINYNKALVFEVLPDHIKKRSTGSILEKIGSFIKSKDFFSK